MTEPSILPKTAWWLIAAAVIAVPLFVGLHGSDNFRLPKDSLFMAFGLALAVILVARIVAGATRLRTVPIIALTAVLWTAITTALSVNRAISVRTLLWVIAAAAFAMAIDFAARERSRLVIALPLIPAAINAVIFLLQRFHVWNPMRFPDDLPDHFRFTALIGNPDDVGSFLVAPAIVAVALLMTDRARRALWLPVAALLITAIVTGRLTSLIAFGAALLAIGFMRSRRMGIVTTVAVIVATVLLFMAYQPLRKRASEIATAMRLGEYATASAGRVTPFLAAANMARDHPLFGVGPGCFGFEYYPYKIAVERAHPSLTTAYATNFNYGETHNDHLQTLAETGVIGYAIFLVAIIVLARSSQSEDDIVRTTALPLAVAVTILCLAHFPLHLTAATVVLLYVATLCVTWGPFAETRFRGFALSRRPLVATAAAVPAAVIAAMLIYRFAWTPFACNELKSGLNENTRQAYEVVIDRYRATRLVHANLGTLATCMTSDPTDIDFYMLAAANYRVLGRNEDAVTMYKQALTYDRRPEIYYNLGMVELGMNQRAAAVADLLNAARFSREYLEDLPGDVRAEINAAPR